MRPLKLVMTAFGPYANTETIDFLQLNSENLFLISGPTGSGKTTIFDAICYALFGESSSDGRTGESLRSQFAANDILTTVELDFELNGTKYSVSRTPRQLKPKTRGEGFTEQSVEASLTVHNKNLDFYTGATNVNNKIENIIGLTPEQFKQIMMIPQGEFRKLLIADSKDREKILQKLFDTKVYNSIQFKLENKSKDIYSVIKDKKTRREEALKRIDSGNNYVLQEFLADGERIESIMSLTTQVIAEDKLKLEAYENLINDKNSVEKKLYEEKNKAEHHNKTLEMLLTLEEDISLLEKKTDYYKTLEFDKNKAMDALRIIPLEDKIKNSVSQKDSINLEISKLINKQENNNIKLAEAEQRLAKEKSSEATEFRKKVTSQIMHLESLTSKVTKISDYEGSLSNTRNKLYSLKEKLKQTNKLIVDKNKQITDMKSDVEEIYKLSGKYQELKNSSVNLELKLNQLCDINSDVSKVTVLKKATKSLNEEVILISDNINDLNTSYKKEKLNFLLNQAAVLAKDLKAGVPCPVCGSTEHPSLACGVKEVLSQQELDNIEQLLNGKKEELNKLKIQLTKKITEITQLNKNINSMLSLLDIKLIDSYNELILVIANSEKQNLLELNRVKEEIADIENKQNTMIALKSKIEQLELDVKKLEEYSIELKDDIQQTIRSETTIATKLSEIYSTVPESIRDLSNLQSKITEKKNVLIQLDDNLEIAIKEFNDCKNSSVILNNRLTQYQETLISLNTELTQLYDSFNKELANYGFSNEQNYQKSKKSNNEINEISTMINTYNQRLYTAKQQKASLATQVKGRDKIDVSKIQLDINTIENEVGLLRDSCNELKSRIKNNNSSISMVKDITEQIFSQEKQYNIVGHLAKIANGKSNEYPKITFERYVLAAFLEDILNAANSRLLNMTSGRYKLLRSEETERRNKQSGLELEVFDYYTGKKRHVKTLSGGESFKASLGMALGLADVVQSYAGGIKLDTMFVDEGFGTLDPESLDNAITCLIDLQKTGRLVGIISHVPELKERIRARLEVNSTNSGSTTKFIIP